MDRLTASARKVCHANRFLKLIKKKSVDKPKVKKIKVNEDLSKPYRDYVRIACATQMKIVGHNVLMPKFKWNFIAAFLWIDVIIYLFINASNIWIFWGDTKLLCFCFVTYAFGFTGLIRIYTAVAYCPTFYEVFQTIYRFAKTFDRKVDLEEI